MTMLIGNDGKLNGSWYKQSPNVGGPLMNPTLIVMHFTAGGAGAADWLLRPEARASAHLVVERNGDVKQIVPFTQVAWHAGASSWRGRSGCNAFSIGIEIANWGPCDQRADGHYYNWAGGKMPLEKVVEAQHKNGGRVRGWEIYDPHQLDVLEEVTRALLMMYGSLNDIAGHDDVAPSYKVDPGPLFPMQRFRSLLGSRGDDGPRVQQRKVIATVLNLRDGPGTQYEVITQLREGSVVQVLEDLGEWSRVEMIDGKRGFVFDAYLA